MDSNTKKILLYGGGAILLGSVAFFVYSFFRKDNFTVGNTTISLGNQKPEDSTEPKKTFFKERDFSDGIGFNTNLLSKV